MTAIKYERELLTYLQSCKKKPTPAGIWSAAIELMEAKFSAANYESTPLCQRCDKVCSDKDYSRTECQWHIPSPMVGY